jgi:hypothetical protein
MDFDLSPRLAQQLFDGEAGSYYSWSSSEFPLLAEEKVGAGRLVLQPRGFALPHYADSSKIGYVLQGICTNSLILSSSSSSLQIIRYFFLYNLLWLVMVKLSGSGTSFSGTRVCSKRL